MKQTRSWLLTIATTALLLAVSGCKDGAKSTDEAQQLMATAYQQKNYNQLMQLADSLEKAGDLLPASANYWRGYACDRLKQREEAAAYWKASLEAAGKSGSAENVDIYVKSASRLANLLCLNGDYQGTLDMAQPVVARLEELQCDTTSDYVNLLIYIGLSQVSTGMSEEDTQMGFLRACEKHRQNINRTHSDAAYKDAIAGLVNIAYYCVQAKKYEQALYYTSSFGELLIECEQHSGIDAGYVDRQVGRYTIYKAWALDRLGRKEEAAKAYESFLDTNFSKSAEGMKLASDYQSGLVSSEQLEEEEELDV